MEQVKSQPWISISVFFPPAPVSLLIYCFSVLQKLSNSADQFWSIRPPHSHPYWNGGMLPCWPRVRQRAESKTNLLLSPVPLTGWILLNQVRGLRVHGYPDNKALDVKDESQKNQQVSDALGIRQFELKFTAFVLEQKQNIFYHSTLTHNRPAFEIWVDSCHKFTYNHLHMSRPTASEMQTHPRHI